MTDQQELEAQELAFRLIKDSPYKAMDYLDQDEDSLTELFKSLNKELNGESANEYERVNW
jgi:hypothetical protein